MFDASQKNEIREKCFDILFLRTPISILGGNKIEGIEMAVNRLEGIKTLPDIRTVLIYDNSHRR